MLCPLLFSRCTKENKENIANTKSVIDTLHVTHSVKGWEVYSWPAGSDWKYSLMAGTNRTKTYEEVTSVKSSDIHLITITGIDALKLELARFPENEFITMIGQGWLQASWGGNYGNLRLPPQGAIDDIKQFCRAGKLNLSITQ